MKLLIIGIAIIPIICWLVYRSRYSIKGFTVYDTKQKADFEMIREKIEKAKNEADLVLCIKHLLKFQNTYTDFEGICDKTRLLSMYEEKEKELLVNENLKHTDPWMQVI